MMIIGGILIALVLLIGLYVATTWAPELTVEELRPRFAAPPSAFLNVAGMKVHMRDEGPRDDPSPIVLLHGTAASLHTWDGWVEALKSSRRVVRFDLPGFGLTGPSPDRNYSIDNAIRLLIAMVDHLAIERAVLGGNSLGGVIAWRTAVEYPARVERLILVDSAGYPAESSSAPLVFYLAKLPSIDWIVRNTLPRTFVAEGLRHAYADQTKVTPELIDQYCDLLRREGNRGAFIDRARQRRPATSAHRIAQLKLPTLIIWGRQDRMIPPEAAERFHHDIAGSTLVMFDNLGHVPQEEDPARTVVPVKQFLEAQ
jgi:pimeloyl-ACP methyl ester carboxylesterase